MKKYQYLYAVEKHVDYIFDRKKIVKELEDHIDDNIEELIHEGYTQEEAEVKAVEMMGNPHEVGKELNKLHNPWIGYLLMLSRIVVLMIILTILSTSIPYIKDTIKMLSPIVYENSEKIIKIDEDVYLSTHKLIIDNICTTNNGTYVLTYRCFRRYDYTRTPNDTTAFILIEEDGGSLIGGVHRNRYFSLLGHYGEIMFKQNKDNLILLLDNNEKYIINMQEYNHE